MTTDARTAASTRGLLVRGQLVDVGLRVVPPASHGGPAWCRLGADDYAPRAGEPQMIVVHTTGGRWPQPLAAPRLGGHARDVLEDWAGANRGGGERVHSGAHLVVDWDGVIYCAADVVRAAAYHAGAVNARSIGIELCTTPDGGITQATIDAGARLVAALTYSGALDARLLSIPFQVPAGPYRGVPIGRLEIPGRRGDGADLVGVIGHRDQTAARGAGDPGDRIWDALRDLGAEPVDYAARQEIQLGRARQAEINARDAKLGNTWAPLVVDGVVGPRSIAAARRLGFARWRDVPTAS